MNISNKGMALIKRFEGFRSQPYQCAGGVWSIGYGTTQDVTASSLAVTKTQADTMLRRDIKRFEAAVNHLVTVPLNQHQFDALVSFTYNVGEGAFARSTLLKKLNSRDYQGAAQEFHRWNKASGRVLRGLVRRRNAESELFLKPLSKSRTLAASTAGSAGVVGTASIDALQQSVDQLSGQLETIMHISNYLKWGFMALSLLSFGMVVYARIDDWRTQVR